MKIINFQFLSLVCACPLGAEVPDIPASTCPEDFGQVQKVAFQRVYSTGTTKNSIVIATTNPNLKATWTALQAASDGTKVTVSPFIQGPETEPGEKIEFGGGNATLGGVPITVGIDPTTFEAMIYKVRQNIIEALKSYGCENVGVFLFNANGQIAGLVDDVTTPTTLAPFPIQGFFVSDKKLGGFEEPDSNKISWSFPPNWSDKFGVITPTDFAANTDL